MIERCRSIFNMHTLTEQVSKRRCIQNVALQIACDKQLISIFSFVLDDMALFNILLEIAELVINIIWVDLKCKDISILKRKAQTPMPIFPTLCEILQSACSQAIRLHIRMTVPCKHYILPGNNYAPRQGNGLFSTK